MKINTINSINNKGINKSIRMQDSILKNIQKQINKLQGKINEIKVNDKLTYEQKTEKIKAGQEQMSLLRQQYTQRQLEVRKQQREKAEKLAQKNNKTEKTEQEQQLDTILSADSALRSIKTNSSVRVELQGEKRVLDNEIKTDAGRGLDVSEKIEEAAELSSRLQKINENMADADKKVKNKVSLSTNDKEGTKAKEENEKKHIDVLI
jgi:hypothetical protein